MPERLRQDFLLQSPNRELLNYRFAHAAIGIKIYSYVEKQDTKFHVLSTIGTGGESVVEINQQVVDSRSAKLGNAEVAVDEEEVIDLNTTHTGTARFTKEEALCNLYVDEIVFFLESFSAEERAAYDNLNNSILKDIKVDVHQFYRPGGREQSSSTKIITGHPSLKDFFDHGPSECLRRRLIAGKEGKFVANGVPKPEIRVRHSSQPENPIIKVAPPSSAVAAGSGGLSPVNTDKATNSSNSLTTPSSPPVESFHTKRPSFPSDANRRLSLTVEEISSRQPRAVQFSQPTLHEPKEAKDRPPEGSQYRNSEFNRRPQRSFTFQLPGDDSNLFKWIHVPWNHTGWVPHILTRISREKANLDLHNKILLDQMWLSQHNRSRHASPHARFVRPSVRCLLPERAEFSPFEGTTTPRSAIDGVQVVIYMRKYQ